MKNHPHVIKTYTLGCRDFEDPCSFEVTTETPEETLEKNWKHSGGADHLPEHQSFRDTLGEDQKKRLSEMKPEGRRFLQDMMMMDIFRSRIRVNEYEMGKIEKGERKLGRQH